MLLGVDLGLDGWPTAARAAVHASLVTATFAILGLGAMAALLQGRWTGDVELPGIAALLLTSGSAIAWVEAGVGPPYVPPLVWAAGTALILLSAKRHRAGALGCSLALSAIPLIASTVHLQLVSQAPGDAAFNVGLALLGLQHAVPVLGLLVQGRSDREEHEQLSLLLEEKSGELEMRTLELEAARTRLEAHLDLVSALIQPSAAATHQAAVACLSQRLDAPAAALFGFEDGSPPTLLALHAADPGSPEASLVNSRALAEALRSRPEPTTCSTTAADGAGEVCGRPIHGLAGWPIMFEQRCLGVLLVAHAGRLRPEQQAFVLAALHPLAIRLSGLLVEEQRRRLVTHLEAQGRILEASRAEAMQASRVKSEFLASVSHELKTPLNAIIGFTHRLLRRLGDSLHEQDLDALHTVQRNAQNLLAMISDVLDMARMDAGKARLERAIVDANEVVREAVALLLPLADGKPLEIGLDVPRGRVMLHADRMKLQQVVTNLVSNAIKYTDCGSVTVSLREAQDPELGAVARVVVKDTGIGIRPEDRPRLFQQFTQLDASTTRRAGGTGLGLVISSNLVRLHGGRIDLESEPGRGSAFIVLLPLAAAAAEPAAPSLAAGR
jgi:signal transduction histidine kinase